MPPRSLSIFFPMYNEAGNIEASLHQILEVLPQLGCSDVEILVVDDGSKDESADLVRAIARTAPAVRLVQHRKNQGYGAALRTGFLSATKEAVFYTDSDLPIDLSDIVRALPLLDDKKADLVIGYRKKRYDTPRRALYSRVYNFLMRYLFGVRVRDVNFSFKLVHRRVLDRVLLSARTVFIDGQLLAEAVRNGFRLTEIPIDYRPRQTGASSFNSLRAAWVTLVEMLRYRINPESLAKDAAIELITDETLASAPLTADDAVTPPTDRPRPTPSPSSPGFERAA